VANECLHVGEAWEQIHRAAVLANRTGNRKLRLHFIEPPTEVGRQNGSDGRAAFVACDVGFFTAVDRENTSAAIRVAEVRMERIGYSAATPLSLSLHMNRLGAQGHSVDNGGAGPS
jgi:hypothetical protein